MLVQKKKEIFKLNLAYLLIYAKNLEFKCTNVIKQYKIDSP